MADKPRTIDKKILEEHLLEGELVPGHEIGITIDQALTQDATGTVACLQFESLKVSKVKTELSVSYVDHNTSQQGYESADDHKYLQTVASRYGILFSKPGNGICHQVHLDRVENLQGLKVDQVCIGSCTNSSYEDLMTAAEILKGSKVHYGVSLIVAPGSRQVLEMISANGALSELIQSGALIVSGVLLLCHIGEGEAAVAAVIAEGRHVTYDLKPLHERGSAVGTREMAEEITKKVRRE